MNTPESRSGLRIARFWKTKASINMPVPATAQAIDEPRMPVATPNRAGSEKTPAPTMEPTTIAVSVGRVSFPVSEGGASTGNAVAWPPSPDAVTLRDGRQSQDLAHHTIRVSDQGRRQLFVRQLRGRSFATTTAHRRPSPQARKASRVAR